MSSTTTTTPAKVPALITTALVVVAAVFPVLSLVAIVIRGKARRIARQPFQSDEYWIVASWILSLSLSINAWTFGAITGLDYYKIDPLDGVKHSLMCLIIASSLVQLPLSAVKISILFFYKRIFTKPTFKIAVWITIPFVVAWGAIFFVLVLIQGDPVTASWIPGQGHLRWNSNALGLAQVGSSVALDVIILCFPLPVIFGLHMPTQRKVAIALIFWVGAFCCVAAIVRLILLSQSVKEVIKSYSAIYVQSKQFIFMIIEPNCSIIAACLPCYGPLFANGRSPQSLVRSVRSVFSLHSSHSSGNRSPPKSDTAPRNGASIDSQIELKQASSDWYTAHNEGHVTSNVESSGEEDSEGYQNSGINVTKAYDVTRVDKDEERLG